MQTYNPISDKLQVTDSAPFEIIPLHFIGCIIDIITDKLRGRISLDIYRGLVLESAQRIVTEHLL